ncbi:MAG: zinc metallopeptidase [Clostridia bacterium]|nr:zinc metallopeptidase [Clostridia bacterium]
MFYGYGYFSYLLFMLPVFILGMVAQSKVKSAYNRYSAVRNSKGLTGAAAAQMILNHYGISDVAVVPVAGKLSDHYSPNEKVIRLSEGVYNSASVAAVGIACHEAGHAAQHAEGYMPNKIRTALVPFCNFGSRFGIIIAFIGAFIAALANMAYIGEMMIYIGLALYGLVAVFQLVTLPVEFNASKRAMEVIESDGLLYDAEEIRGAKKVLSAAAMTYVAALATSVANLLYYIIRFTGGSRRR